MNDPNPSKIRDEDDAPAQLFYQEHFRVDEPPPVDTVLSATFDGADGEQDAAKRRAAFLLECAAMKLSALPAEWQTANEYSSGKQFQPSAGPYLNAAVMLLAILERSLLIDVLQRQFGEVLAYVNEVGPMAFGPPLPRSSLRTLGISLRVSEFTPLPPPEIREIQKRLLNLRQQFLSCARTLWPVSNEQTRADPPAGVAAAQTQQAEALRTHYTHDDAWRQLKAVGLPVSKDAFRKWPSQAKEHKPRGGTKRHILKAWMPNEQLWNAQVIDAVCEEIRSSTRKIESEGHSAEEASVMTWEGQV